MKQKNEWAVICEKCGWEGHAKELRLVRLEDKCPKCRSNQIAWKGEDDEQDMEVLRDKLADREGSAYYETSNAREESFRKGWDACLEYCIRKDRTDFAALYKELAYLEKQKNEKFKAKIAEALHWIHEGKTGNAIQILNHLAV